MKQTFPLYLIAIGLAVIILQNAGIILPLHESIVTVSRINEKVNVDGLVTVSKINETVNVDGNIDAQIISPVDVNLHSICGYDLVNSERGMYIGVNSVSNTIIPINWGEISISP